MVDRIPDSAADEFVTVDIDESDICHLQYTSGATRSPAGVEITHRLLHESGADDPPSTCSTETPTASAGCRCTTTWVCR